MKKGKSIVLAVTLILALLAAGLNCAAEKPPAPAPTPAPKPAPSPAPAPAPAPSPAEEAAKFYEGKIIEFYVTSAAGGGYDAWSRMTARFLKKYIPVKEVVVINMPGAGGALCTDHVYRAKGSDGLAIMIARAVGIQLTEQLGFRGTDARWECNKFKWLCKLTDDVPSVAANPQKFKTMDDVRADKEFLTGVDSMGETSGARIAISFEALGLTNGKIIPGWSGGPERRLAVIRGELDGTSGSVSSMLGYYEAGDMRPMWVLWPERIPELPDVPSIYELGVQKEAERWVEWEITLEKIGRTLVAPPDTPENKVEFLRDALAKVLTDPEFIKAFKKVRPNDEVKFLHGKEVEKLVKKVMAVSAGELKELDYIVMEKYKK